MNIAVLIPAYNPSEELVRLVEQLASTDISRVIVVNDGSDPGCDPTFQKLQRSGRVVLLKHAVNLGKGAALKTGLNYAYSNFEGLIGIVTADADGQHLVEDVLKVARSLESQPESLVIGTRVFGKSVPLMSIIGNTCTRQLFRLLAGKKLRDTQSGLRGIPMQFIPKLLKIEANGYEFELEMLLACKHGNRSIVEEQIHTIYIDGNKSSHFNVLLDSMKIYFVLFRFMLASFMTAAVDYVVFLTAFSISSSIFLSLCVARAIAVFVNYTAVKNLVFLSDQKHRVVFPKYVCLVIVNGLIAYGMINFLAASLAIHVVAAKMISELTIYLGNFAIQRDFIFSSRRKDKGGATDWNHYHSKPSRIAALSRKVMTSKLIRLMEQYGSKGCTVAELGGANSCFFEPIKKKIEPGHYHIIDNSKVGLHLCRSMTCPGGQSPSLHDHDVLDLKLPFKVNLAFSIGLIEHFPEENTAKAIRSHFELLEPGGIAVISFPTPTVLYRVTRFISEVFGMWIFHDERPLEKSEVAGVIGGFGTLLREETVWPMLLTQCIMVARKEY
ncbi:MAG: glycosyltransferase [Syntrophobacteraceae bacterium]|jgi:glycosyltransferase involved in cell wall biosynthesis